MRNSSGLTFSFFHYRSAKTSFLTKIARFEGIKFWYNKLCKVCCFGTACQIYSLPDKNRLIFQALIEKIKSKNFSPSFTFNVSTFRVRFSKKNSFNGFFIKLSVKTCIQLTMDKEVDECFVVNFDWPLSSQN